MNINAEVSDPRFTLPYTIGGDVDLKEEKR